VTPCEHCGAEPAAVKGKPSIVVALAHFVECPKRPADAMLDWQRDQALAQRKRSDKIADAVAIAAAIAAAALAAVAGLQ
jgi:hypothetical protein